MAVRSRRLFGPTIHAMSPADQLMFQVPDDRTAIFRGLSITVLDVAGATVVWVVTVPGQVAREIQVFTNVTVPQTLVYPAALILNPGDQLRLLVFGTTQRVIALGVGSLLLGGPI